MRFELFDRVQIVDFYAANSYTNDFFLFLKSTKVKTGVLSSSCEEPQQLKKELLICADELILAETQRKINLKSVQMFLAEEHSLRGRTQTK